MSMDPQAMAAMLASQLGGSQPQQGGMQAQVQPLGAAAQLAQKIMLMNALRKPPQQQPPAALPGMPAPQSMDQQPMPGGINA